MYSNSKEILNNEITFVIQGPIIRETDINKKIPKFNEKFIKGGIKKSDATKKSCESIRKYFPGSKIILSTWKNSYSEDLNIDTKVESDDPGANHYYYENNNAFNNTNRMIVSSYQGLISVNTKFCVKLRTDMYFQSNNLKNLLGIINSSNCLYTNEKIIIPSNMATNPDRENKLLFQPSDAFFAGLTEDLVSLFDIPLMSDEQMIYFKNNKNDRKNKVPILSRYTSEQYLLYSFIKKKTQINFRNAFDFSKENKLIHDKIFSNLFAMYRNTKIGVNGYKYPISFFSSSLYYAYTENEFNKLSGKEKIIDAERLLSNFVRGLKFLILLISKNFYFKMKNYFIKKI